MKNYWWGILTGLFVMCFIPLLILVSGAINMGATTQPTSLEKNVAAMAIKTSMYWRKPEIENPVADKVDARQVGLEHYRSMCVRCHGGPGIQPKEFAKGLNPPAPMLEQAGEEFSDAELFWITKHGIRMTGMPAFGATHGDTDIWKIVEAVKGLSNLTAEEKEMLKNAEDDGHDHHDEHGH